jgi:hypothetical protein
VNMTRKQVNAIAFAVTRNADIASVELARSAHKGTLDVVFHGAQGDAISSGRVEVNGINTFGKEAKSFGNQATRLRRVK